VLEAVKKCSEACHAAKTASKGTTTVAKTAAAEFIVPPRPAPTPGSGTQYTHVLFCNHEQQEEEKRLASKMQSQDNTQVNKVNE
jgi:hypothetical protein